MAKKGSKKGGKKPPKKEVVQKEVIDIDEDMFIEDDAPF